MTWPYLNILCGKLFYLLYITHFSVMPYGCWCSCTLVNCPLSNNKAHFAVSYKFSKHGKTFKLKMKKKKIKTSAKKLFFLNWWFSTCLNGALKSVSMWLDSLGLIKLTMFSTWCIKQSKNINFSSVNFSHFILHHLNSLTFFPVRFK